VEVPILRQGQYLIASIQSALTDADLSHLREALIAQVGRSRCRGVIVDVTALDVMDSFAVRTLRDIAHMARLRGAETVIVGIQPDVAFAMVQLGLTLKLPIAADVDVVEARQQGRALAAVAGFSSGEQTVIAAAISEIARNILMYAKKGEITLSLVQNGDRQGVSIVAVDQGPGIPDIERAMQYGYSTSHGVGAGLPGAKRLMDEFEVDSVVGRGTTITMKKWRRAI